MGIKSVVKRVGTKVGNKVAQLSELSPVQVESVQYWHDQYLMEMPNPNDPAAVEMTSRMMAASSIEIFNAYLPQIKDLYLPIQKDAEYEYDFDPLHNIRYFNITKWVTDSKENSLEKLVNVYAVLSNEDCNIALVFNRTKTDTNVYLAVVNNQNDSSNVNVDIFKERLMAAIRGNFPGAELTLGERNGIGIIPCLNNDKQYSVATASNIPTEKSEKFISQTIEKLLDGIIPETKKDEYTIVLLATPIRDVEERKLRLGEFYSGLAPYASWQTDFHFNDSRTFGSSATVGVNVGASAGVQNGTNNSITDSNSETDNTSRSDTESTNRTETDGTSSAESESNAHTEGYSDGITETEGQSGSTTESKSTTRGHSESYTTGEQHTETKGGFESKTDSQQVNVQGGGGFLGFSASASYGNSHSETSGSSWSISDTTSSSEQIGWNYSTSNSKSSMEGWIKNKALSYVKNKADTLTHGLTSTISNSIANSTGSSVANTVGKALTKAASKTSGIIKNTNLGVNFGANFARSSTVSAVIGKNEGITQSYTNFNIKHALELLESQMKRFEQSAALGMWDFAAYVLSENPNVSNNVAHSYLALTLGEESYMSKSAINLWRGNVEDERYSARVISSYIKELRHPLFGLSPYILDVDYKYLDYPPVVTATTSLSGKELSYSLNFPQKSISGLPVFECAEFGRNIVTYDLIKEKEKNISLGNVFHMNHVERGEVKLSLESLRSHAFITGSTGSGKSNTIYQILDRSLEKGIKFLVVEPAKGEYKHVFGNDSDVQVYGTNPDISPLLKINPFSFPKGIHILEHLDRLVEIFNVCWPMYAAMPAVLKSAIERSYEDCGWNLTESKNEYGRDYYPTFSDVARNIKNIIDLSEYDTENKGAYKGSLLTRLQSLSNGMNGMIFVTDSLSDEDLFEKNVILDLSRVGSTETKALIMGMIVIKLQEYRLSSNQMMNSELRHLTILEEAHNLLRRTSTEQSNETSNILGKSVEMIANSIAEMRTYGEGFLIVDQAPGLMDMSVIRNTNTKIIMRLPDQGDRELVGLSANLNEDQIKELSKLPCGVAAVYQNEWIQPVLCKIDRFDTEEQGYSYENKKEPIKDISYKERLDIAKLLSNGAEIGKDISREEIEKLLENLTLTDFEALSVIRLMEKPPIEPDMTKMAPIMSSLFPEIKNIIKKSCVNETNMTEWTREANEILVNLSVEDQVRRDIIQSILTNYMINETNNRVSLEKWIQIGGFK